MKLFHSLRHNTSLQRLYLSANKIDDATVTVLADCLPTTSLTSVYLNGNDISHCGSIAICKALMSSTITLKSLDLMHNSICDGGAIAIAEGLRDNKSLLKLSLMGNKIGDQGAIAIAKALSKNTTLKNLSICCNKGIGDIGACAFGEMLASNNTRLETLHFSCCKVGNRGIAALGKGLSNNRSLLKLNIGSNLIDDEGAVLFAQNFKDNVTFEEIVFHGNKVRNKGAQEMRRAKFYDLAPTIMLQGYNLSRDNIGTIYYSWRACAGSKKNKTKRYPIHVAADKSLKWEKGLKMIVEANYAPLIKPDDYSGLYPFMLSAAGKRADLETTYRLLRLNPGPMGYC